MKNYCLSLSNIYLCYVYVVGVIKLLHIVILRRETIKSPNVRPACVAELFFSFSLIKILVCDVVVVSNQFLHRVHTFISMSAQCC